MTPPPDRRIPDPGTTAPCRYSGVSIQSAFPLGIPPAGDGPPDWVFTLHRRPFQSAPPLRQFTRVATLRRYAGLSLGRRGADYLLRFGGTADFYVLTRRKRITCRAYATTRLETVRRLFLDQVMPRVLSLDGGIVLHAGAVQTPAGAIAFVGESGRGKSTLTAALCRGGFPGIADDSVLMQETGVGFSAVPGFPGVRLRGDAASHLFQHGTVGPARADAGKRIWDACDGLPFAARPAPLYGVYALAPAAEHPGREAASFVRLSRRQAFMALAGNAFRLDTRDPQRLASEFARFIRLASAQPVWQLRFRRDLAQLDAVRDCILEHLDAEAGDLGQHARRAAACGEPR